MCVHAIPVSTIDDCNAGALDSCIFTFDGYVTNAESPKVLQLNYLFADHTSNYDMPHLETPKSTNPIYNGLSECSSTPSDCIGWTINFVFYGYIGMDGTTVTSVPEMLGDRYIWHGFRWGYNATCTTVDCVGVSVHTTLTFNQVQVGEWEKVPLPTTVALLGLGL